MNTERFKRKPNGRNPYLDSSDGFLIEKRNTTMQSHIQSKSGFEAYSAIGKMARALKFPGGGGGWAPDLDSDYGVALHAHHRSFASF